MFSVTIVAFRSGNKLLKTGTQGESFSFNQHNCVFFLLTIQCIIKHSQQVLKERKKKTGWKEMGWNLWAGATTAAKDQEVWESILSTYFC